MKVELTQGQIDGLIGVERVVVKATVFGVGYNDVDFKIKFGGVVVWQYLVWRAMLGRCFSEVCKAKQPAYRDVSCCDTWLYFGNFLEWANKEVGYSGKPIGMQLDKDILTSGNKIYSPENCCFVPKAVNCLLTSCETARGEWPVGVSLYKQTGRFVSNLNRGGKLCSLGYYTTPEEAFAAYKIAKEAQIKLVALQHKAALKPAAFESLMNWEIEP